MDNTVISGSIKIEGELICNDDLTISGSIKGKVISKGNIKVEESGDVDASVEAVNLEVAGRVIGDMTVEEKVEIVTGGHAVGDISAERILIADGAVFRGNVDMSASKKNAHAISIAHASSNTKQR